MTTHTNGKLVAPLPYKGVVKRVLGAALGPSFLLVFLDKEIHGVSFVEEQWTQQVGIHCPMSPVFAEDVSWVHVSTNMVEPYHVGSHSFSNIVVGQGLVPLAQPRVGNRSTSSNRGVVPEEVGRALQLDPKVSERGA